VKKLLKKYKVKSVPQKVLHDYSGMNYHAAKVMGFHPRPEKEQVFVSRSLKNGSREETIKHEIVEDALMKKGYTYFGAHLKALKEQEKTSQIIEKDLGKRPKDARRRKSL
jgi:hypothetical protein